MLNDNQLADLFEKLASGSLNNQESESLREWAAESPLNEEILKLISGESVYGEDIQAMLNYDQNAAWKSVKRRTLNHTLSRRGVFSMVAAILIISTLGFVTIRRNEKRVEQVLSAIEPGKSKAELILSDGSTQILSKQQAALAFEHKENAGAVVAAEQTSKPATATQEPELITLRTAEGCEYQYELPEGTIVWLNAMSSITFPREFTGKERRVQMEGEVFFDVAKDASKPFIIDVISQGQIRVLGTSFNVKAYSDGSTIETTLIEGKVWMRGNIGEPVELTPGMQAIISRESQGLEANSVNTEPMLAWKEGYFLFDNERLDNICDEFCRWYNIDIRIGSEELAAKRYSLRMLRQTDFAEILNMLVATRDIDFKISKKNVIYLN
ncbi:MAG: FecR domain-containing protein [Rikenellaceae bacterium]